MWQTPYINSEKSLRQQRAALHMPASYSSLAENASARAKAKLTQIERTCAGMEADSQGRCDLQAHGCAVLRIPMGRRHNNVCASSKSASLRLAPCCVLCTRTQMTRVDTRHGAAVWAPGGSPGNSPEAVTEGTRVRCADARGSLVARSSGSGSANVRFFGREVALYYLLHVHVRRTIY